MWVNCRKNSLIFTSQTKVALEFCLKIFDGPSIPRYAPLWFSAVDSDPDGFRIPLGPWIRIQIRIRNPDPDPGGQK
jgi:hypothetical protein